MRLRRRAPFRTQVARPTLTVVAPMVVDAWPIAMECLRSELGTAVVDLHPNPVDGSMRVTATSAQREAGHALALLALERVSDAKPRSPAFRTRFSQVEFDVGDPSVFALLQLYGPCAIAVEITRKIDQTELLGTWDEGSTMTVALRDEEECASFLECVRHRNLDPSVFDRS